LDPHLLNQIIDLVVAPFLLLQVVLLYQFERILPVLITLLKLLLLDLLSLNLLLQILKIAFKLLELLLCGIGLAFGFLKLLLEFLPHLVLLAVDLVKLLLLTF